MTIIDDKNPNITPISTMGEFKLIDNLTHDIKCFNKTTVKGIVPL